MNYKLKNIINSSLNKKINIKKDNQQIAVINKNNFVKIKKNLSLIFINNILNSYYILLTFYIRFQKFYILLLN